MKIIATDHLHSQTFNQQLSKEKTKEKETVQITCLSD